MVITMFVGEAKPWLDQERFTQKVAVPGLSKAFPEVSCTEAGLCLITTSMGYANAASSISALIYSGRFDLSQTYFLIAGIAGVDPADGTLGSAHWARFAVDGGLQNVIDAREIPNDWSTGYVAIGARDRKSTRLNSSHANISYAVFCLKKKIYLVIAYSFTVLSSHASMAV